MDGGGGECRCSLSARRAHTHSSSSPIGSDRGFYFRHAQTHAYTGLDVQYIQYVGGPGGLSHGTTPCAAEVYPSCCAPTMQRSVATRRDGLGTRQCRYYTVSVAGEVRVATHFRLCCRQFVLTRSS